MSPQLTIDRDVVAGSPKNRKALLKSAKLMQPWPGRGANPQIERIYKPRRPRRSRQNVMRLAIPLKGTLLLGCAVVCNFHHWAVPRR